MKVRQVTIGFTGETAGRRHTQSGARQTFPEHFRIQRQCNLAGGNVTGLADHPRQVQGAVIMHVTDGIHAHLEQTRRGVDFAADLVKATLQCRSNHKGLHGRARLKDIGDRAIAQLVRLKPFTVIGIERWLVDQRQHLTTAVVQHHHRPGARTMLAYRCFQLPVGQVLDTPVDTQPEGFARVRGTNIFYIGNGMTTPVLDHTLGARVTA